MTDSVHSSPNDCSQDAQDVGLLEYDTDFVAKKQKMINLSQYFLQNKSQIALPGVHRKPVLAFAASFAVRLIDVVVLLVP